MMTTIQTIIRDNMIRGYKKLSVLSQAFTFVQTERIQRFESDLPFGMFNSVLAYKRSEEADPVEEIKSIASKYRERGRKLAFVISSHEHDEVINQALTVNDFNQVDSISGMALSLDDWTIDLPDIQGFEVRAIRDTQEINQYKNVILEGFDVPEKLADLFSMGRESPIWRRC